jgi:hypothetical protein
LGDRIDMRLEIRVIEGEEEEPEQAPAMAKSE